MRQRSQDTDTEPPTQDTEMHHRSRTPTMSERGKTDDVTLSCFVGVQDSQFGQGNPSKQILLFLHTQVQELVGYVKIW